MILLLRLSLAAVLSGAGFVAALILWPIGAAPSAGLAGLDGDVGRGAYLARAGGCIACHTDLAGGGAPLAGGAPLRTDFGVFYPPNLTTDPDHGIGGWTIEAFAAAVREGVSPDGKPYYPTFTYPFYGAFTDQQIADLWVAFQTVAPVAKPAPPHEVAFPFNLRWGLKPWRALFLDPPDVAPVAGRSDVWNRGRELVQGATHCAACHTARNLAGARVSGAAFAGNDALPGGDKAPSIRADALISRGWTVDTLAYALQTGLLPDGDVFGGSMGEVVQGGTRFMTPGDRTAIATYLMEPDEN